MTFTKKTKDFFIIKKDSRGLDYNLYENLGNKKRINLTDYNSDNTKQLNISEIVSILKKINIELN